MRTTREDFSPPRFAKETVTPGLFHDWKYAVYSANRQVFSLSCIQPVLYLCFTCALPVLYLYFACALLVVCLLFAW